MVVFDLALSPVSCGLVFFPCVPSKKKTKLIKEALRELLKEVKTKIFPIITHTPQKDLRFWIGKLEAA